MLESPALIGYLCFLWSKWTFVCLARSARMPVPMLTGAKMTRLHRWTGKQLQCQALAGAEQTPMGVPRCTMATATSPLVWIKLYLSKYDQDPSVFDVVGVLRNVSHLKERIKEKAKPRLDEFAAHELRIYPPGTEVPIKDGVEPIDPGDKVLTGTKSRNPLIVVAPRSQQQQEKDRLRQKEDSLRQKEDSLRQKEYLLLQHSLTHKPSIPEDAAVSQKLDRLEVMIGDVQSSLNKPDRATPQKTPASHGKDELVRLDRERKVTTFKAVEGESSILTQDQVEELSKLQTEHHVVAFLTPHLERIFRSNDETNTVVVNSEEYKWLQTSDDSSFNQKPDLFICHKAIYEDRPPFKTDDKMLLEMRRSTDVFGVLADWRLRRFLYLVCEAKKKIDNSGLGETINYGSHICFEEDGPVTFRLILFDRKEFWLVECVKGAASAITKCEWSKCGSVPLLRNFALRDPLIEALDEACRQFNVSVDENSFLGQGAVGVVFRVKNQEGKFLAMKIVSDKDGHVGNLKVQAEITKRAKTECPDHVVGIESDGFLHFENKAGVLLLSEAGEPYSTFSPETIRDALAALHSADVLHGDCRVENIVNVNGKAQWIDLRAAYLFLEMDIAREKAAEMGALEKSIERAFGRQQLV